MLGLILWAALIIFIVICVNGWGFIGMLLLCGAAYLTLYALLCWIKSLFISYAGRRINATHSHCEAKELEREKAIDEWERKWKRKHPCRK